MTEVQSGIIIVTACKNEEDNLPGLIEYILKQTIKTSLWVIVDESSDNTPNIIKEAMKRYKWIRGIFLGRGEGYLGKSYTSACKTGFTFAIEYCKENGIGYEYIGLVDADALMTEDYFEKLISKFERNPKLGVASGREYWNVSGKLVINPQREELPIGPARLWRVECFTETGTGGYDISEAPPDTVSNIKAKLTGWETKQFADISVITRQMSTARGLWKGLLQHGEYAYVMYTPLYLVMIKTIKYLFKSPYYIGLAYILGYVSGLIRRIDRIRDDEIITYMKHERPKELFRYYLNKLSRGRGK